LALVSVSIPAQAQESSDTPDEQGQQQQPEPQQTASGKTVKKPPPPVFHKHRRGVYLDTSGLPVVDATPQSPPLETDDPGVPDKGELEINFTTDADLSKPLRAVDYFFVDANYGVLPKVFGHELPTQIKLEFPLAGAKEPGNPTRVGIGAAQFGLKFNFYNDEHRGLYFSVYPQIEFAFAGSDAVEKDLAEPGQTLILPLLVQKEFKHLTLVANGAINQPIHDPERETTGTLGVGLGRALTRHLAVMAEIRATSTFDLSRERLLLLNFGVMRRLRDDLTLYAKVGRGILSDEGFAHTYLGVGVKFVFTPKL
jgi:hypothetical protein